jgi:hypothetical protein
MTDVIIDWRSVEAEQFVRGQGGAIWKVTARKAIVGTSDILFTVVNHVGDERVFTIDRTKTVTRVEWGMDEAVALVTSILPVKSVYQEVLT